MKARQINFLKQYHEKCDLLVTLKTGAAFGELALEDGNLRTATIVAKTSTHLVSLSKKSYKKFLQEIQRQKNQVIVDFLLKTPVFQGFPESFYGELGYSIIVSEISFGSYVYKEGQSADFVYFVMEGEVEVKQCWYTLISPPINIK